MKSVGADFMVDRCFDALCDAKVQSLIDARSQETSPGTRPFVRFLATGKSKVKERKSTK